MTTTADVAGRRGRGRSTWDTVEPSLIRELLAGTSTERGDLDAADDQQPRRWADTRLQTPLALQVVERHTEVGRVLRGWFQTHASDQTVCDVADAVWRTARVGGAPTPVVPDDALEYLVLHELLHHILPGQGHDAEFSRLEGLWPGADRLDAELDTLAERYHLGPGTI